MTRDRLSRSLSLGSLVVAALMASAAPLRAQSTGTLQGAITDTQNAVMGNRRGILAYDAARRTFSALAVLRPPLLIERGLVLCSGFLPHFDTSSGRVEYAEVPLHVAQLAGQLLRQEVR